MNGAGELKVLNTSEFWKVMCHPAFVRLTLNQGQIGRVIYFTDAPPETVPGFLGGVTECVVRDLKMKTLLGFRWPL